MCMLDQYQFDEWINKIYPGEGGRAMHNTEIQ